jgi:2-oxoglutarate dehydrogenase E2 component (dihydrolipoamide succinyltransferase)
MVDDARSDDDLEHALFGDAPEPRPRAPEPASEDALDDALFGPGGSSSGPPTGRAVGYAAPPLPRSRRILVALGVIAAVVVVVMATVAFASGSPDEPKVQVPRRAGSTSTSVTLKGLSTLPVASTPPPASTEPEAPTGVTATTRRRTTAPAPALPAEPDPDPAPAPTDPPVFVPPPPDPTTAPTTAPTTSAPPTTQCPGGAEICNN